MAEFNESLTVRIVGDSRHLDRELGNVVRRLIDFENRMQRLGAFQDLFGGITRQVNALSRPLQGVNHWLAQIGQQLVMLSQYPVTINVVPALVSLEQVSRMIDLVMFKLQQMAVMASMAAGPSGGVAGAPVAAGPVRQFAGGGYVSGPAGVDRVPAMLTAGEYVLQRPVVQMLGRDRLDRLNIGGGELARSNVNSMVENRNRTDIHHYGGFTFHVSQPVPMAEVLRSIRNDRLKLKTRRG